MKQTVLHQLAVILLISAFTASCSKEPVVSQTPPEPAQSKWEISKADAAQAALEAAKQLDRTATKSSARIIYSDSTMWFDLSPQATTRSASAATVPVYVFNLCTSTEQDAGFVLVSGDTRAPEVIMSAESGHYSETPPFMKIIKERIPYFLSESIEQTEHYIDSVQNARNPQTKTGENEPVTVVWTKTTVNQFNIQAQRGPLTSTNWGQYMPYNDQVDMTCPQNDGGKAPVGCVATAMGQIMAYHRFPTHYNYDLMYEAQNYAKNVGAREGEYYLAVKNAIASFFHTIDNGLGMTFNCTGSGANTFPISQNYGYSAMQYLT